jgi:hypothetical protein
MTTQEQHHWSSRKPAKQDEVREAVVTGVDWILARRKESAIAAGALVVLAVLGALFAHSRTQRRNEAWEKLAMAEAYSYYGRPQEALDSIAQAREQGSPAATAMAGILESDIRLARGEAVQAAETLERAAESAPEALKPFVAAQKAAVLEQGGKNAECAAAAAAFLAAYPDHFLAPHVLGAQARCQAASGQAEAARKSLQDLTLQYPDSPWAARANARLQRASK